VKLLHLLCSALIAVTVTGCQTPNAIKAFGFKPLEAPNRTYRPGTVLIQWDRPYSHLQMACSSSNVIKFLGDPEISPTTERHSDVIRRSEIFLSANATKLAKGRLGITNNVHVQSAILNPSVVMYPSAPLKNYFRNSVDPICQCEVADDVSKGTLVHVASACLIGDISYTITDERGGALSITTEKIKAIQTDLEAGVGGYASRSNRIFGTNLIIGYFPDYKIASVIAAKKPQFRISNFRFLDETHHKDLSNNAVLTNLTLRSSSFFRLDKKENLRMAFFFLLEGYVVRNARETELDVSVLVEKPDGTPLAQNPAHTTYRIDDWKQTSIVQQIGIDKVARFVHVSETPTCASPIPYIVLLDQFSAEEVPDRKGVLRISVVDHLSKRQLSFKKDFEVKLPQASK
jgi:hypothetical protein